MGTHKCTMKELEIKQLEEEKKKWLLPSSKRKKKLKPQSIKSQILL